METYPTTPYRVDEFQPYAEPYACYGNTPLAESFLPNIHVGALTAPLELPGTPPQTHEPTLNYTDRPVAIAEGLQKDAIEFGAVALEALIATIYPRFPHSEATTDPRIIKERNRKDTAQKLAERERNYPSNFL